MSYTDDIPEHDYERSRQTSANMIARWGTYGVLRRQGLADRLCKLVIQDYTAIERIGKIIDPVDRYVLLSPFDPDTGLELNPEPSSELDRLVVMKPKTRDVVDETLRIVAPPGKFPGAGIVLYWELRVRQ